MKRNSLLKRNAILTVLAGSIILLFLCIGTRGFASTGTEKEQVKLYTSATIAFGESFRDVLQTYYSDAAYRSYREFENEVLRINHLTRVGEEIFPKLSPGDAVIVPYFSAP